MSLRAVAGFRHLTRHPWQLAITLLGVSLGVGVFVAMQLAIQSSREAFRVSTETVAGRATHQVTGGATGVADSLVARIRIEGRVRAAAPVVEGIALSPLLPRRPLRVIGIDPFMEAPFRPFLGGGTSGGMDASRLLSVAGGVVISRETAERLGVGEGDPLPLTLPGGEVSLRVIGVFDAEDEWSRAGLGDLLVVDLSEAQDLFGMGGRLDRIDLILSDHPDEPSPDDVAALLPPGTRLEPAGSKERAMEQMIRAFDLNLTALSLLALVFGIFLIYNTMTFSVVQRRRLIGTLRALGATRREILGDLLREALVLGLVGSAVGLALGVVMGRGLVRLVTATINDLYFVVSVDGLSLAPGVLLSGALLGVGATFLAAIPPAWEAGTVSPREALARSFVEDRVRALVPRAAVAGAGLSLLGALVLLIPGGGVTLAFVALFVIILGMALLTLPATVLIVAALRPVTLRVGGIIGAMAARGVVTALSRTAPAVAALVIAVSVSVGLGVMIQSFRGSVVRWLDTTLQADLYISPPSSISNRADGRLPEMLREAALSTPGVDAVSTARGQEFSTAYGMIRLVALELPRQGEAGIEFLNREPGEIFARFRRGEGVFVSEPFAFRNGVAVGDSVQLEGERGELSFPVLGVFRDYGAEMGVIMITRTAYDDDWTDPWITSLALFLEEGTDASRVEAELRARAGPESALLVRSNRALREMSLEVFDRTFTITRVLRGLAFIVAFIAVLSALMALQLERVRELGVLRANGMTPAQCWGLITAQTGIMGLVAGALAVPAGLVLSLVMIFVVNVRSFGWTLQMEVGWGVPGQAVLLALAGSLLAGVYPAWKMSRTHPAEALRGE